MKFGGTARRVLGASAVLPAVAAALLAAPATSAAATSCQYTSALKFLQVDVTGGDEARLSAPGANIVVNNGSSNVTCTGDGAAPLASTDNIFVSSQSGGGSPNLVQIDGPSRFGDNGVKTSVNLHDVAGSALQIFLADAGGESIHYGSDGIGATAGSHTGVDITPTGVPVVFVFGGAGVDSISGHGGSGTGSPRTDRMRFSAGGSNDSIVGGDGDDILNGGDGADQMFGFGGDDALAPGSGSDLPVDGGTGTDTVAYDDGTVPSGVSVDLALTGPQNTGGAGTDTITNVENVTGTDFPDVLRGDGGPNTIRGLEGGDVMEGRGAADVLQGAGGDDDLLVRDGGPDSADCGANNDTVTADAQGVDTITGCESALFAPSPAQPAPPPAGGLLPTTLAGATPPAALAALRSLHLAPTAFAAFTSGPSVRSAKRRAPPRGAIVSFSSNVPATVTYRVARPLPGRRVGRRCEAPKRSNRTRRRCTRLVLVRSSFTRAATKGSNRFRFTGRLGGRALAPGSYQLQATPRSGGRNGATTRSAFRIIR